jgi:hypothetical protein
MKLSILLAISISSILCGIQYPYVMDGVDATSKITFNRDELTLETNLAEEFANKAHTGICDDKVDELGMRKCTFGIRNPSYQFILEYGFSVISPGVLVSIQYKDKSDTITLLHRFWTRLTDADQFSEIRELADELKDAHFNIEAFVFAKASGKESEIEFGFSLKNTRLTLTEEDEWVDQ